MEQFTEETTIFTSIRIIALLAGWLCCCPGTLAADGPVNPPAENDALRKKQAQAYFTLGEAHFGTGEYRQAAEAFSKAYDILPHYAVLANVGLAAERAGDYVLAVTSFRKYLVEMEAAGKENPQVETLLRETLQKVSELVVSVDESCGACHIQIDGVAQGARTTQAVVLPGTHHVGLIQQGQRVFTTEVSVASGETRHVTLVVPIDNGPPTPAEPRIVDAKMMSTGDVHNAAPGYSVLPLRIAVGTTIGAGIAAGILWGAAVKIKKDFDNTDDMSEKTQLQQTGERLQVSAVVATGIAVAAGLTTGILALVKTKQVSKKQQRAERAVRCAVDASGIGIRF